MCCSSDWLIIYWCWPQGADGHMYTCLIQFQMYHLSNTLWFVIHHRVQWITTTLKDLNEGWVMCHVHLVFHICIDPFSKLYVCLHFLTSINTSESHYIVHIWFCKIKTLCWNWSPTWLINSFFYLICATNVFNHQQMMLSTSPFCAIVVSCYTCYIVEKMHNILNCQRHQDSPSPSSNYRNSGTLTIALLYQLGVVMS